MPVYKSLDLPLIAMVMQSLDMDFNCFFMVYSHILYLITGDKMSLG